MANMPTVRAPHSHSTKDFGSSNICNMTMCLKSCALSTNFVQMNALGLWARLQHFRFSQPPYPAPAQ